MSEEKQDFFDKPDNIKKMLRVFYVICIALVALDLVFHRHVTHPLEAWFGFYAFYGFVACVLLVLAATELRKLVMRDEDYYDES